MKLVLNNKEKTLAGTQKDKTKCNKNNHEEKVNMLRLSYYALNLTKVWSLHTGSFSKIYSDLEFSQ